MLVSICARNLYLVATNYCYNVLFTLVISIIIIIIVVFVVLCGRKVLHCYGKKLIKYKKKKTKIIIIGNHLHIRCINYLQYLSIMKGS